MNTNHTNTNDITGRKSELYTGHEVVDAEARTIGTVTDVIYDDDEHEPTWLVIDPGLLRSEHYAPVEGSYTTDDGRLVVPFDKEWFKQSPKADSEHVIDGSTEQELAQHYGERGTTTEH